MLSILPVCPLWCVDMIVKHQTSRRFVSSSRIYSSKMCTLKLFTLQLCCHSAEVHCAHHRSPLAPRLTSVKEVTILAVSPATISLWTRSDFTRLQNWFQRAFLWDSCGILKLRLCWRTWGCWGRLHNTRSHLRIHGSDNIIYQLTILGIEKLHMRDREGGTRQRYPISTCNLWLKSGKYWSFIVDIR